MRKMRKAREREVPFVDDFVFAVVAVVDVDVAHALVARAFWNLLEFAVAVEQSRVRSISAPLSLPFCCCAPRGCEL